MRSAIVTKFLCDIEKLTMLFLYLRNNIVNDGMKRKKYIFFDKKESTE